MPERETTPLSVVGYTMHVDLRPEKCVADPSYGLPIVVATIYQGLTYTMDFLVDTGADVTTISQNHARLAGFNTDKGEVIRIQSVTGDRLGRLFRNVRIDLYERVYRIPIVISPVLKDSFGLLGRAVLFKSIQIGFHESQNKVYLGFEP